MIKVSFWSVTSFSSSSSESVISETSSSSGLEVPFLITYGKLPRLNSLRLLSFWFFQAYITKFSTWILSYLFLNLCHCFLCHLFSGHLFFLENNMLIWTNIFLCDVNINAHLNSYRVQKCIINIDCTAWTQDSAICNKANIRINNQPLSPLLTDGQQIPGRQ